MAKSQALTTFGAVLLGTVLLSGCGSNIGNVHEISAKLTRSKTTSAVSGPAPSHDATSSKNHLPPFEGNHLKIRHGSYLPPAVFNDYQNVEEGLIFSSKYVALEAISGQIHGYKFVLEVYEKSCQGLFIGVRYDHHTVYFGYGPSAWFQLLAFTGEAVLLGNPSSGMYMRIDLATGSESTENGGVFKNQPMLFPPNRILGLPGLRIPSQISGSLRNCS